MGGSPRVVTADVQFTWDNVPWRLHRGQVIDVPPGSALEEAIGASVLAPLNGPDPQPAPAPEPEPEPAPRKSRAAAKDDSSSDEEETS